jgi:hypothetical protein
VIKSVNMMNESWGGNTTKFARVSAINAALPLPLPTLPLIGAEDAYGLNEDVPGG